MKMLSWSKRRITITSQILITHDLRSVLIGLKARTTYLIPLFLVVLFFVPTNIIAQDEIPVTTTISDSKVGNQTITTNVTVEVEQNSLNGSVMISSAIVIGFTSLGALIEISRLFEYGKSQVRSIIFIYVQIAFMIILHLTAILHAYMDTLTDEYYVWVIVTTIFLVIGIIVATLWLVFEKERADTRRTAYIHELENDLANTRSDLLDQLEHGLDEFIEEEIVEEEIIDEDSKDDK